jgi:branched-chain amino acid transport system substrate-binding protein
MPIITNTQKAKVPLISCAASVLITQPWQERLWVFSTPQRDNHAIEKLIGYMKAHNMKRVGFIYVSNKFGDSGRQQAELLLPKAGIKIVATETFGPEDTVMTTQVTNLARANPDAIICWGTNPGPARIAATMYDMKLKIPLLQSHGVANRKFIELAGPGAEGVVLPAGRLIVADQIPASNPQKKALLAYARAYKARFGQPADTFGGHASDAIQLVVKALRAVGPDRAKIRDYIEKTKGFVGIGGIFNFSRQDHNGLTGDAFVMVRIENGQWKLISEKPASR